MTEDKSKVHLVRARAQTHAVSGSSIDRFGTVESVWAGGEWAEVLSLDLVDQADFNAWEIASF